MPRRKRTWLTVARVRMCSSRFARLRAALESVWFHELLAVPAETGMSASAVVAPGGHDDTADSGRCHDDSGSLHLALPTRPGRSARTSADHGMYIPVGW